MNWEEWYSKEDPWGIRKNKLVLKRAEEMKKLINRVKLGGLLFDGGCGEGFITDVIFRDLGVRFIGLDISRKALERAKRLEVYQDVIQGDISQLPFKDETFDFVLLSESIYYVKNWKFCLDEGKRILKENGYILISVALGKNYLGYWEVNREFKKRFSLLAKKIVGTSMLRTLAKILINHPHYAKYLLLGQKVNRA